jgi:hypothetical protein
MQRMENDLVCRLSTGFGGSGEFCIERKGKKTDDVSRCLHITVQRVLKVDTANTVSEIIRLRPKVMKS